MAANNEQVVAAWAAGREAQGGNLTSTGSRLFSYALQIGGTYNGAKVVADFTRKGGTFYSVTTSRHVSIAKQVADEVFPTGDVSGTGFVWSF
jgi:hypothetical protein